MTPTTSARDEILRAVRAALPPAVAAPPGQYVREEWARADRSC